MTEHDAMAKPGAHHTQSGDAAALLRGAREAAGMSIDTVAQHLKLAPRQVKALEDGDYAHLPGRTFIRGFARNYARLMHLDPERVLSALPGGASAPALEAPTLTPTAHTMGELPTTDRPKASWARWAIPLLLAAIVAVAALYEWMRPAAEPRASPQREGAASEPGPAPPIVGAGTTPVNSGAASAPAQPALPNAATSAPAATPLPPAASSTPLGTPLPNPLATNAPSSDAAAASAGIPAASTGAQPTAASTASSTPSPASPSTTTMPAPSAPSSGAQAPASGEQSLVFALRKSAWIEVRDRDGRLVVSKTFPVGTQQTVSGTPPLAIRIGNASDVSLRYKGQPVDLAPHTRANTARLTLR